MQPFFIPITLLFALALASPYPKSSGHKALQGAAANSSSNSVAAIGGSVLKSATFNDISISSGTAGNAEAEASALFSKIDTKNLAAVSKEDLDIIKGTHDVAEDAEVKAFNPAIDKASGDAATALKNGKIKNKVLKLTAEVLGIQVKAAQGGDDGDLAAEQKKLSNNIALDKKAAGQKSTAVDFSGNT